MNQIAFSPAAEIAAVPRQFYVEARNMDEETHSEIDDLLPSSLCQSRCLLKSATFSASHLPASASGLGGAPALPSPGLTVGEIDSTRDFSRSGGGHGCGIGGTNNTVYLPSVWRQRAAHRHQLHIQRQHHVMMKK